MEGDMMILDDVRQGQLSISYPVNLTWILEMMESFSGNPPKTNMEPENDGF